MFRHEPLIGLIVLVGLVLCFLTIWTYLWQFKWFRQWCGFMED